MAYTWATEMCPDTKFILKANDDSFVDTFHLPHFLDLYGFNKITNFFLCFVVRNGHPKRNIKNKWYVSYDEFQGMVYPNYCSGSAYVTQIETMKKILSKIEYLNYLFIDDLMLTGIAAYGVTTHYDMSSSFLEAHTGSKEPLLSENTSIYTPELLAAMNLNSSSILTLWRKAKACHDNVRCYGLLKTLPDGHIKPKIAQSATRYVQRVICNSKNEL